MLPKKVMRGCLLKEDMTLELQHRLWNLIAQVQALALPLTDL